MNEGFLQNSSWSSCVNNQAPAAMSLWHDDEYSCQEQELPVLSWSQLLLGGSLIGDFEAKKPADDVGWEDQMATRDASPRAAVDPEEIQQLAEAAARASWCQKNSSTTVAAVSSPRSSCVTTSFGGSSNMLDFSSNSKAGQKRHLDQPPPVLLDHSSECNSKETGAAAKKIRVAPFSAQSTFKVRKEKLGDRIAVLHQMVSPFGKTDTASVLLEAIGYIRFLHNQIEALSSPYLGGGGGSDSTRQQPPVKGRNCIFPEDPGQVDGGGGELMDLRSRGLCLVPLSTCTSHVGGGAGADHWAAGLAAGLP
ncbi:transcription factor bHLH68-like [Iris pallida]|uniref:Transcription factor bHLH68-like n=1 Tax=Iris pallida TaxID=29817 RepID=A0AAX6DVB2_IRIPA|nr:transcription factor bHLH68-like [Iris pallida]